MAVHLHRNGFVVCIDNGPRRHWPQTTVRSEVTCRRCRPEATEANTTTRPAAPVVDHAELAERRAARDVVEAKVVELIAELDRLEAAGEDTAELLAELRPILKTHR